MSYGYPPPQPMQQPMPHQWPGAPDAATQLKPLAIAYTVYAVFIGLGALLVPVYLLIVGAAIASAANDASATPDQEGAALAIGGAMTIIFGLVEVLLIAKLVFVALAARGLFKVKGYTLCFIAAILCCLNMPIGLALGIWTFVVISKPQIKAAFT